MRGSNTKSTVHGYPLLSLSLCLSNKKANLKCSSIPITTFHSLPTKKSTSSQLKPISAKQTKAKGTQSPEEEEEQVWEKMKLIWSPDTATKAYIDTVRSRKVINESGVAELVSAMAAGWNAKLIVETWSQGGAITTSIGLEIASHHTCGRHVCVVPDEKSRSEFITAMKEAADMNPEVIVGEPEEVMSELVGIDFMVVDCKCKDFARVLRQAKLNQSGAVLVCKNANSRSTSSSFRWRSVIDCGSRRVVRTVFLPVGKGLDMAHVSSSGGNSGPSKVEKKRWFKHFDQQSGEEHVIRKSN